MRYLEVDDIIIIHERILARSKGGSGLRDPGLLVSATQKPQMAIGGQDLYPDIFQKAAILFEALVNYHVFVDGNKRTAFISTASFLSLNDYYLDISIDTAFSFIIDLTTKKQTMESTAIWLQKHSRQL